MRHASDRQGRSGKAEKLDRWIVASVGLHVAVVLGVFVAPSLFQAKGTSWGSSTGGSGGVNVRIVGSMSGLPLPAPVVATDDAVAGDSKSLYKAPPEPKVKASAASDPDAVKLPSKTAPKAKPDVPVKPGKAVKAAAVTPSPSNAVTYGSGGGQPSVRYGQFATGAGGNGNASNGPTGADFGGDGTFGDKYGPYVDAMTRAIQSNWVKVVSGAGQKAPKVYVTFTIARDGSISNLQIQQSGNQPIMDRNAIAAVRAAKLQPLPPDYRGADVNVRFYFDYGQ